MTTMVKENKKESKKLDLKLWKQIFKYLFKYKKTVGLLMFFMANVAIVDAILPQMTKKVIDDFIIPGSLDGLSNFIIMYIVLITWMSISVYAFISLAGKIEMYLSYDIRKSTFAKLQELSFSYYDTTPLGWIMARMTSDIRRLGEIISWGIVDIVWGISMMFFIAVFMFIYNWKLALLTLSVMPVLVIASSYFRKKILREYRIVRKTNSKITGAFSEGIAGAKTTKTLVREEENFKEFNILTNEMRNSSVKAAIFSSLFLPIVLVLSSIGIALVIWVGGNGIVTGAVTYGTLVMFMNYAAQYFDPISQVARVLAEFQQAQASAERVISLIEEDVDIFDKPEVIEKYGTINEPKYENWEDMYGNVSFENVSFNYKNGEKVLSNFNLEVKAGDTIALVGQTGSGKSTIVNLICRFYEPTTGVIKIDGKDYKERSIGWLHGNLGYVLQSPHLFSGSIKENIRYGKLNATDEEIIEAAKLINAHEFITELSDGYDTEVGEGGGKLSTGEKQLISFTRALIAKPSIFILDEATSSIDTQTEQKIQYAIEKLLEGRTSFIIAHRLSTVVNADRILVINKGEIIEDGTHNELLDKKGHYYQLYEKQFSDA